MPEQDLNLRHPSTKAIMRYFEFDHLPEGPLRNTSETYHDMAYEMMGTFDDSPELVAGLRHLLEAKDCHVRCALDLYPPRDERFGGPREEQAKGTGVTTDQPEQFPPAE
jgi:hypothetical protein